MPELFPHICFVAPNAYPLLSGNEDIQIIGGAELQVVLIAKLLAARGRRVSMICLDFGQLDETEIGGIKVFRAYRPNEGIPIVRFIWPRLTSIWKCLKHVNADIYYQQTAGQITGVMTAFCKHHKRKSIFAAASNPDLFQNTPRIKYARDRWMYAYGLRHVDRIFVQNDEQAELCRVNVGREPILVRNCYELPRKRNASDNGDYILWVSTVRRIKRPELFLDLAEALPDLQFRMIGGPADDEAGLFEYIKSRAESLCNVQFLGFVPFSRTDDQFDQAKVFVNTSDSEGFPNTFLQAWARGVPTVSFVDAGARLNGEPIGQRVESFDDLVARVAGISTDQVLRQKIGQRGIAYVKKNHSPEKIVELYESVFLELVGSSEQTMTELACRANGIEDDPER